MAFAKAFLSELDDADYAFLWREYFAYKYLITEKSKPSEIEAEFDYEAVETEGLMYAYRDVLPFGEPLEIAIDDEKYIIFDTYCVRPGCSCTDTTLSIFSAEPSRKEEMRQPVCDVGLTYGNKSWAPSENRALPVSVDTARLAIEEQIPGFYKKLKQRHRRLKRIYAECKKKHDSSQQPVPSEPAQKVGRNATCPCGSGKKYKKCCG